MKGLFFAFLTLAVQIAPAKSPWTQPQSFFADLCESSQDVMKLERVIIITPSFELHLGPLVNGNVEFGLFRYRGLHPEHFEHNSSAFEEGLPPEQRQNLLEPDGYMMPGMSIVYKRELPNEFRLEVVNLSGLVQRRQSWSNVETCVTLSVTTSAFIKATS